MPPPRMELSRFIAKRSSLTSDTPGKDRHRWFCSISLSLRNRLDW